MEKLRKASLVSETDHQMVFEARFWNQNGKQLAIVATVTKGVDWGAYIGTDAPNSWKEEDTVKHVCEFGCKLSEADARHFFPNIETSLPYRH